MNTEIAKDITQVSNVVYTYKYLTSEWCHHDHLRFAELGTIWLGMPKRKVWLHTRQGWDRRTFYSHCLNASVKRFHQYFILLSNKNSCKCSVEHSCWSDKWKYRHRPCILLNLRAYHDVDRRLELRFQLAQHHKPWFNS